MLSVNTQTPAIISTTHRPTVCEKPTSGLNDQRCVPRLITFVESYCPSGGATVTLTPTMVSWMYEANSRGVIAGAPYRFIASRTRGSPRPNRPVSAGAPRYIPSRCPPTTGSTSPALADRPARLNARVNATTVVLILALASSMGSAGSNARSPQLKLLTAVMMLMLLAIGQ